MTTVKLWVRDILYRWFVWRHRDLYDWMDFMSFRQDNMHEAHAHLEGEIRKLHQDLFALQMEVAALQDAVLSGLIHFYRSDPDIVSDLMDVFSKAGLDELVEEAEWVLAEQEMYEEDRLIYAEAGYTDLD